MNMDESDFESFMKFILADRCDGLNVRDIQVAIEVRPGVNHTLHVLLDASEFESFMKIILADRYGLNVHGIQDVIAVRPGINHTLRVLAEEGEFYLRSYRMGRNPNEIAAKLCALQEFRATDAVSVAKPRPLQKGGLFFPYACYDQIRFAALFEEAPGEQPDPTPENLCRVAEALGEMQWRMGLGPLARPFAPERIISDALESLGKLCSCYFSAVREQIERARPEVLGELSSARLIHGFCHGDAWLGNVRFSGHLTTFFDFDDCHHGPLVGDLARLLRTMWDDQQAAFGGLARGILDAYRKASGVDPGEFRAIPPLARLGEIATLGFLARYCILDDAAWERARQLFARRLDEWAPDGKATRALLRALEERENDG